MRLTVHRGVEGLHKASVNTQGLTLGTRTQIDTLPVSSANRVPFQGDDVGGQLQHIYCHGAPTENGSKHEIE